MKLFSIIGLAACVCLTLAVAAAAPIAAASAAPLATEPIASAFDRMSSIDLVAGLLATLLIAGASVAAVVAVVRQAARAEMSIGRGYAGDRFPASLARASPDRPLTPT